ncbi:TonB-dependent receptor [Puniceicoccaceae bacterium K14]|nr:TonB-dependent receptor [Puniceicoccaceae bacterium K14]
MGSFSDYSTIFSFGRIKRLVCSFIGCILFLDSHVSAETLSGQVRDARNGNYISNAIIKIEALGRRTKTDREGRYTFRDIDPGSHTIEVFYLGYNEVSQLITLSAGSDLVVDLKIGADIVEFEDLVVDGTRGALTRALQQKRVSTNSLDVIAANAIGKLPDDNAAEAVRRLPGVVAEIDQGEGRFIVVRGVDSALNNITINGQVIGSPDGGSRAVAMDTVPSDLISRIEVIKAVTPDMDHNAIGASVNIVTPSAFDRGEPFATVRAAIGENDKSGHALHNGSATFGTEFGDGKWGFVLGLSQSYRRYASDLLTVGQLDDYNDNRYYVPSTQKFFDYDVERKRSGINGALEFRPEYGRNYYLRASLNTLTDDEGRDQADYDFTRGDLTDQTETSGSFSEGRASREFRSYLQEREIISVQAGTELILGNGKLDANITVGSAKRTTPRRIDWEFRSSSTAFPNNYDLSPELYEVTPSENFYDSDSYPFRRVRRRTDSEVEDLWSAKINYSQDTSLLGGQGSWKTGVSWLTRDKSLDRNNENYTDAEDFKLSDFDLSDSEPTDFFDGSIRFGPTLDYDALEDFFFASPEYFEYDESGSFSNSTESDFEASEDVIAAYAMTTVDYGYLTLLGGVRIESTEADYAANEFGEEEGEDIFRRITGSTSYTNLLPGIHFVYEFSDRLQMRGAWTNTLGRPAYADLAPTRNTDIEEDLNDEGIALGTFTGSFDEGNSELDPYESMNFDVGIEYYLSNNGIFSAAVFHKVIDNPIYKRTTNEKNVEFEGRLYSELSRSRPTNGDSGEITGLELNYQQYLTFLPAPFDGLGFSINYTWTDSKVEVPEREGEDLPFFKQADGSGNFALYYEKSRWDVRLALNYSGAYITGIGSEEIDDFYVDERLTWDFKAGYKIDDNWSVFGELLNFNEEPLNKVRGSDEWFASREIYSWNARVGINWNM